MRMAWTTRAGTSSSTRDGLSRAARTPAPSPPAAARTPPRRSRRPRAAGARPARPSSAKPRRCRRAARDARRARSPRGHPSVTARASIAACLPEQLLCRRVGRSARLAEHAAAPRCDERLVRAADEIPLLQPEGAQHALGDRDVLRLATVRGAGERELVVAPVRRDRSRRSARAASPGTASRRSARSVTAPDRPPSRRRGPTRRRPTRGRGAATRRRHRAWPRYRARGFACPEANQPPGTTGPASPGVASAP